MNRIDPNTLRQQIAALEAAFPEIAEDEILRGDMFEAETDLHEFLSAIEEVRRKAVNDVTALDLDIVDMRKRRDRFRNRDEAIRALMLKILQWADLRKVELTKATIAVRRGTPRVVIVDEQAVPDAFCRIVRDPDRTKIREALNAFEEVSGASLSNAEPVLTIRTT